MKYKLSLLLTLLSINLFSEEQLYLVDLILIKYLPDFETNEKFLPPEEKNVDNDYKYSRDTYYELVEKGKESLELMIEVARESEHPRAFEVLSGMIKNISDVNDRLMDLNKKKKDLDKKDEIQKIATTTNNLFVGSTTELQKLLKKDIIDVTPKPE